MNYKMKSLLQAVAENNIQHAKQYAKCIVEADKTQANKEFCSRILNILQSPSMDLVKLPHNLEGIISMEDVSISFNEGRYYLSSREKEIFDEVLGMYQTSQKLSEMGINYLNSLMLHGESGTGKTLFGRYLAYKLELPFVYMNFSNTISSYLGTTGKNISNAFEFVEKQKCVFMIDEVDAIGMKRGKEDVGEMARITIGLMQALDCLRNDTIIIGATNRLDMIDVALLRRFSIVHNVKKFSEQELYGLISRYLDDVGIRFNICEVVSYCNSQKSQAIALNDVVRAISRSVRYNTEFKMVQS